MARVFIPPALRTMTAGLPEVDVDGGTVREILNHLDASYPGIQSELCRDDRMRPGWMVVVDSAIAVSGLRHPVRSDSEVHFLPAIGGG